MSSFQDSRGTEIRGLNDVLSFIKLRAFEGRYVCTDKGTLSEFLQAECGDIMAEMGATEQDRRLYAIELKTEEEDKYGNLFLETWSNLNFDRRKPGWMWTLKCDILLYYFLASKELYSIDFRKLWAWFHGQIHGNMELIQPFGTRRYTLKLQKKCVQLNRTTGLAVPINDLISVGVIRKKWQLKDDGCEQVPLNGFVIKQAGLFDFGHPDMPPR